MYGWRARIGMIMANANTTMEPEFNRLAPQGVSMHASRILIESTTVLGMTTNQKDLAAAARMLTGLNARVIAYSCNGSNVTGGLEGEAAQTDLISKETGCPAILAATAVLEAIAALGVNRVSFATLYPPDLNECNTQFWKECGVDVLRSEGLARGRRGPEAPYSSTPVAQTGLQQPAFVYNLARSALDTRSEAMVVIGGNVRTIEIAEMFESDHGIPFISTNIALFWASLQIAGIREAINGYGTLLRNQPRFSGVRGSRSSR